MDITAEGSPQRRSDRWAIRAVWLVIAVDVLFALWSYWQNGIWLAGMFLSEQVIDWGLGIVLAVIVFAVLSLALAAWPGRRSFWVSTVVMSILVSIPNAAYDAESVVLTFSPPSPYRPFFGGDYLIFHPLAIMIPYDLLVLVVSPWVIRLYFPAVRGWRFTVFWVFTVAASVLPGLVSALH